MKTHRMVLLIVLGWLAVPASVWAFYNPETGRWLSRDPVEEPAFLASLAGKRMLVDDATLPPTLEVPSLGENPYGFVHNESIDDVDYLGLLPESQATVTIADCSIQIYAGHGYRDSAFDDDGKLKNPKAVDRLKYPHHLKGTKCSAGAIIACNAKKFATVEHLIPGVPLDDAEMNVAQGIVAIDRAVKSATAHAETICKNCRDCKEVTIKVNCHPPFRKTGVFRSGSKWCGETIKVPCKRISCFAWKASS